MGSTPRGGRTTTWLFGITAFVGAGLLFAVQPLVARILLPSYGGSATVWSTASLFFQVALLASYVWAHWSVARFGRRWQPRVQLGLLLVPLLVLPVALPGGSVPDGSVDPALWLLRTLALMVGLPFLVIACTGPLVQQWYAWVGERGEDPYFLFAASNLGSFAGLLAYPFLVEPRLTLADQRLAWSVGFGLYVVLMGVCALVTARGAPPAVAAARPEAPRPPRPAARRLLLWGLLAFVPSSLLLGVTAHLSTDVSPIPLLWVVPLAVYLATFVVAFARSTRRVPVAATRVAAGLALVALLLAGVTDDLALVVTVNIVLLALTAYAAHARLAADRPDPAHLTLFFLVVAAGGAVGGLLNGLVAPLVLDRVLEYPLLVAALPLLLLGTLPSREDGWWARFPAALAGVARLVVTGAAVGLAAVVLQVADGGWIRWAAVAGTVAVGWWLARGPVLLAVTLLAVAVVSGEAQVSGSLERTRSFYGAYRVTDEGDRHVLVHGTTIHGVQLRDPDLRKQATTYYASPGSCADVFQVMGDRLDRVGVVGLGAGTVAAYGRPGQQLTFYEIDADIVATAQDPDLFSFLADSPAEIRVVVGDGRLKVAEEPAGSLDLLVLDAFSSDSIPVHLLTREAMREYTRALRPDGTLLVHVSNRFFDLRPVLAAAAQDLGWEGSVGESRPTDPSVTASRWVALSPDPELHRRLRATTQWQPLPEEPVVRWTDDYSSVLAVLR